MQYPVHTSGDRAVVIGSGFGGLAAAVRLRARGYRVTVLEALDQPGGRARVFRRGGFTFDAGPTVITAPHLLAELFELAGRSLADHVNLVPVEPFYRIQFPDRTTFDYSSDEDRLLEQIRALSPDRKSTRLNSSHVKISYAVFCLKKKKATTAPPRAQRAPRLPRAGPLRPHPTPGPVIGP